MFPIRQDGNDVLLLVKVVPGASRDEIAGVVGDRLKVRVAAPPQDGRANGAICRLLAAAVGAKPTMITVESGAASPRKTIRIHGAITADVAARLAEA